MPSPVRRDGVLSTSTALATRVSQWSETKTKRLHGSEVQSAVTGATRRSSLDVDGAKVPPCTCRAPPGVTPAQRDYLRSVSSLQAAQVAATKKQKRERRS
jgi:hypothetical protein